MLMFREERKKVAKARRAQVTEGWGFAKKKPSTTASRAALEVGYLAAEPHSAVKQQQSQQAASGGERPRPVDRAPKQETARAPAPLEVCPICGCYVHVKNEQMRWPPFFRQARDRPAQETRELVEAPCPSPASSAKKPRDPYEAPLRTSARARPDVYSQDLPAPTASVLKSSEEGIAPKDLTLDTLISPRLTTVATLASSGYDKGGSERPYLPSSSEAASVPAKPSDTGAARPSSIERMIDAAAYSVEADDVENEAMGLEPSQDTTRPDREDVDESQCSTSGDASPASTFAGRDGDAEGADGSQLETDRARSTSDQSYSSSSEQQHQSDAEDSDAYNSDEEESAAGMLGLPTALKVEGNEEDLAMNRLSALHLGENDGVCAWGDDNENADDLMMRKAITGRKQVRPSSFLRLVCREGEMDSTT